MAKTRKTKSGRKISSHADGRLLGQTTSRGLLGAPDALAYERADEVILKDPDVQEAIDRLLDKMLVAIHKRRQLK